MRKACIDATTVNRTGEGGATREARPLTHYPGPSAASTRAWMANKTVPRAYVLVRCMYDNAWCVLQGINTYRRQEDLTKLDIHGSLDIEGGLP